MPHRVPLFQSNIRQRAKEGKDIRYLVTDGVRRYIVNNALYRE
jgi:nicotinic acid mononucleotide adenylyltransferase